MTKVLIKQQDTDPNKLDLIKNIKVPSPPQMSSFVLPSFKDINILETIEDTRAFLPLLRVQGLPGPDVGEGWRQEEGRGPITHVVVFPLQQFPKMTNWGTAQGFRKERKHLFD